jgi:hypothetical protein
VRLKTLVIFLLCLTGAGMYFLGAEEIMPTGITCCDEQKIRQAMTEEALARILFKTEPGLRNNRPAGDYLSDQAYEKIKKHLPAKASPEQRLACLRLLLQQPALDRDIEEFQTLVGHFVLGMTLEIGNTFQDEFDQAVICKEKTDQLLAELEKFPLLGEQDLGRALFHADVSEKELRRLRATERKWKNVSAGASPFNEFNAMKKNMTGRAPDQDQWLIFELAEKYSPQFPFLAEFLENYRRLAADFREAAHRVNDLLATPKE